MRQWRPRSRLRNLVKSFYRILLFMPITVFHKELCIRAAMGKFQGAPVVLVNEHASLP